MPPSPTIGLSQEPRKIDRRGSKVTKTLAPAMEGGGRIAAMPEHQSVRLPRYPGVRGRDGARLCSGLEGRTGDSSVHLRSLTSATVHDPGRSVSV